jgi:hypothetical protein
MSLRRQPFVTAALLGVALLNYLPPAAAMTFTPGDLYSSNYFSGVIKQYDASGHYLSSINIGGDVRGITFGPDGLLYAVASEGTSGFEVLSLDQSGTVHHVYTGSDYVGGNISSGKIAFANNGEFFVAGAGNLTAFTLGSSSGTAVYGNNQVFDVTPLPSGNLLVLSAYELQEITTSGSVVRTINSSIGLGDARGVAYDPRTNDIYVTMLGYTGDYFELMQLDGTTGNVLANTSFWYGDDLTLTADEKLIVGSRTQAPGIFDINLNQTGTLNGGQQMFVTQMPVPEPSSLAVLAVGAFLLLVIAARCRDRLQGTMTA